MGNKIVRILTDHFKGDKKMVRLVIGLLAAGIIVFVAHNTLLFFVDGNTIIWQRTIMKLITDICWVAAAAIGTRYYPTKRNMLLIPTLVFYTAGDAAVMFSFPVGGLMYGIGHVFMLMAILETTYIHKWQRVMYVILMLGPIIALAILVDDIRLILIGIIYGELVTAVMVCSLSNRFFWLAGIVFFISDFTGLIRVSAADNRLTYLFTTVVYFAAFFMLCISVFSTSRKEVVTWHDLFSMLRDTRSRNVKFWVCGRWALGIINRDRRYSYDHIDLAYDIEYVDEFLAWIKHARYEGRHRYAGEGVRSYYSEKYGELKIFPVTFNPDGTAMLMTENGRQLKLDEEFFENVSTIIGEVPVLAPGGQNLTRAIIQNRQKKDNKGGER